MKWTYSRLRIALMTFTLGLAAVYMLNGISIAWNEVPVELPSAVSEKVFLVFPINARLLTREMNCGKDPRDAQARLDCENERLFGNRDQSLYAKFEITCDAERSTNYRSICGFEEATRLRKLVWRYWSERTRAHIVVNRIAKTTEHGRDHEAHYFLEPDDGGRWRLVSSYRYFANFLVDGKETQVGIVDDDPWTYTRARWKVATDDDGPWDLAPRTRYLEFSNLTDDTIGF